MATKTKKAAVNGEAKTPRVQKTAVEKLKALTERIDRLKQEATLEESGAPEEVVKLVKRHAFLQLQVASVTDKLNELGFATDGTKL